MGTSKDSQGNKSCNKKSGFNLVNNKPVAPVLSSTTQSGKYTNQTVQIIVTQPDGEQGYSYEYSINGGQTWSDLSNNMQIAISAEGEYEIVARAIKVMDLKVHTAICG